MAVSTSSCFFAPFKFAVDSHSTPPSSSSGSVRYAGRSQSSRIPASYSTATAERTPETAGSHRIFSPSSLYEVLGIKIGADIVEIKAAYRRLARVLHPDVGNCDSSADEFMTVHSAYETLSDPGKRADYDRTLLGKQRSTVTRFYGYGGRRWETDQCW